MHNTGETGITVSTGYEDCHHLIKINEFHPSQLICLGHIPSLPARTLAFTRYPRSTPFGSLPFSFETACYHAASTAHRSYETCELMLIPLFVLVELAKIDE